MKGAGCAEWLLRRVTSRERAAAQVGDLLEEAASRGAGWFWRAVLGAFLRQGWREITAVGLAAWAAEWLSFRLFLLMSLALREDAPHRLDAPFTWAAFAYTVLLYSLASVATYACVRFGPRDPLTRVVLCLAVGGCLSGFFWYQPVLRWSLPGVVAALLLLSVRHPRLFTPTRSAVGWVLFGTALHLGILLSTGLAFAPVFGVVVSTSVSLAPALQGMLYFQQDGHVFWPVIFLIVLNSSSITAVWLIGKAMQRGCGKRRLAGD